MSLDANFGPVISNNLYIRSVLNSFDGKFNVAHLNCRSIRPSVNSTKIDELIPIIGDSMLDAIGITETWLKSDVSSCAVEIPGYKFLRNDRANSRGGGVGIYLSKKLKHRVVFKSSVLGKCESLFIELFSGNITVLFGVVYLPPPGDISSFEEIHCDLFLNYVNIVVVGDFNCNMFDPQKAFLLRSMSFRMNLSVLHNSKPTHYDVVHGSYSLIDFMLVSNCSMYHYSDQVLCPSISDHSLILASLDYNLHCVDQFVEYRDYRNTDWEGLFCYLSCFDSDIYTTTDIDVKCSIVSSLFADLFDFVPIVKKHILPTVSNWINCNDIMFAKSIRDLSFSVYQQDGSRVSWLRYCKYRNKAKSVIRRVRRNHYMKTFGSMDPKCLWRVLRRSGCTSDNVICDEVNVDEVNNAFVCLETSRNDTDVDLDRFPDVDDSFSFNCVTVDDVVLAINKIKSKCLGVDGIPLTFLKMIFPHVQDILLHLINSILTTSTFPSSWKIARVVPIPKCSVVNGPDDLRPISILPVLSKVCEHVMKEQILRHASSSIFSGQFAFRQGHSTTTLLLHLTDSIRSNRNRNMNSVLVSLDLTKAFNSICYRNMVNKLRDKFNFSRTACKLVMSYLSGRSQFVCLNGRASSVLSLTSGVPQGSVLGPLLFILYVNDLVYCLDSNICKLYLFADDVFLVFSHDRESIDVLERRINLCLTRVSDWLSMNSLSINPSKTKAILFSNQSYELDIVLGQSRVAFVEHHKCLGVVLDSKLCFEMHIDSVQRNVYFTLRRLYSLNIYLPISIKTRLAHALLMPAILYGLEVISGTSEGMLLKLKRIINSVVRFIYNIRRREHISEYITQFLGVSSELFIGYRNIFLFYKVIKAGVPTILRDMFNFSLSSRNTQILIPRIFNLTFERSFIVRIARIWNYLPIELRNFSHSNNAFRLKLLDYFLSTLT